MVALQLKVAPAEAVQQDTPQALDDLVNRMLNRSSEARSMLAQEAEKRDISEDRLLAKLLIETNTRPLQNLFPDLVAGIFRDDELRPAVIRGCIENNYTRRLNKVIDATFEYWDTRKTHAHTITLLREAVSRPSSETEAASSINPNVSRYAAILNANVLPTEELVHSFSHFEGKHDKFLVSLLAQFGETFGSAVVSQLTQIYRTPDLLTKKDQNAVRSFLQTGYRGFSQESFAAYQQAIQQSPFEAKRLMQGWERTSRSLLNGREVSAAAYADPLFVDQVIGAYRPVLFIGNVPQAAPPLDTETVRNLLSQAEHLGRSEHLDPYRFPAEGYVMTLSDAAAGTPRDLDRVGLFERMSHLHGGVAEADSSTSTIARELVKIIKGAADTVDRRLLLGHLANLSGPDSEFGRLVAGANELKDENPLAQIHAMKLVLGDALQECFEHFLPELTSDLKIEGKTARAAERVYGKKESECITKEEIQTILAVELPKVFAKDLAFLDAQEKILLPEGGGQQRIFLTKASHAFLARSSTALCSMYDTWSWNNPEFLQMLMVDPVAGRVTGNIQLHIFEDLEGKRSVLARLNPTESFISNDKVDQYALAKGMMRVVQQFADDNGLKVYFPEQKTDPEDLRMLTNRNSFLKPLMELAGRRYDQEIQVTGREFQNVKAIYELDRTKL